LETWINNARINSCETAKAIVSTAADAAGYSTQETCADLAVEMGLESDREAARRRCATDRPGVLSNARSSSDPTIRNRAPFVGNLTWRALQYAPGLDDPERELIMSMVGTVIYPAEDAGRDPEPIAPTLTSIRQLLYGQADAGGGSVVQAMLRCADPDCTNVTVDSSYAHQPFSSKVETLMRSIASKITSRQPIPDGSPEIGFVNLVSEPVYRMLSVGTSIPGSGLADNLIAQYRDVIAADYAHAFLERSLRIGLAALEKDHLLQQHQREQARELRERTRGALAAIAQERTTLYQKVGSVQAIAGHLEQLERQLRTQMPQQVADMLGRQAAGVAR
jgi:conjugative transfer pilus assembly protein TraH